MVLEVLDGPLVGLRRFASLEGTEVSSPSRFAVSLQRIDAIFTRFQSTNHLASLLGSGNFVSRACFFTCEA
jgi:hypothetical protein